MKTQEQKGEKKRKKNINIHENGFNKKIKPRNQLLRVNTTFLIKIKQEEIKTNIRKSLIENE